MCGHPRQNPASVEFVSPIMSFLAGLTRSSAQFICDRSLATLSSRIALPMVAKTAVVTANVRRNWTQTPEQLPANTKVWRDITAAMDKANVLSHRRDTTPDQAWERRSVFKLARLQHVPLPGPSTGKLTRPIARLFHFLPAFLLTVAGPSRSNRLHYSTPIVCYGAKQARPNHPNKPCTARAYGEQVLHQGSCAEAQAQCHPLETTIRTNGKSKKPSS